MAQWVCAACSAAYAVGAPCCPQCGSTERAEDRVPMLPTIQVACDTESCRYHGVVREVRLQPVGIGLVDVPRLLCSACGAAPALVIDWPLVPEEEEDEMPKITVHGGPSIEGAEPPDPAPGEEEPSPGTSSSTSSAKEPTSPEQSETPAPSRARKTASRSAKARTGSSTAPGTAGGQTEPTSDKGSDKD